MVRLKYLGLFDIRLLIVKGSARNPTGLFYPSRVTVDRVCLTSIKPVCFDAERCSPPLG